MKKMIYLSLIIFLISYNISCSEMMEKGIVSISEHSLQNVEITSHKDGDYIAGEVTFEGIAYTLEGVEIIDDSAYEWVSDTDGFLGNGRSVTLSTETDITPGGNSITLKVSDFETGAGGLKKIDLKVAEVFVEDFFYKTYCDISATTANWNTETGTVSLKNFVEMPISSTFATPAYALCVKVDGSYAYAGHRTGMCIVNITNPENPAQTGNYNSGLNVNDIIIQGNYALAAQSDTAGTTGQFTVVNISDKSNPSASSAVNPSKCAWGVSLSADYPNHAFATFSQSADCSYLAKINISNKSSVNQEASCDLFTGLEHYARGVAASGNYAYVGYQSSVSDPSGVVAVSGIDVIRLSDMTRVATCYTGSSGVFADHLTVKGNYLYAAGIQLGVIDISDPENINDSSISYIPSSYNVFSFFFQDDMLYIAAGTRGIVSMEVKGPLDFEYLGISGTMSSAKDIFVSGDFIYAVDGAGLSIFNTRKMPEIINRCDVAGAYPWDMIRAGDYIYMTNNTGGLSIVDISSPLNPVFKKTDTANAKNSWGLDAKDNYLFIADLGNGLKVLDISDPENPQLAGSYVPGVSVYDVAVKGDYAYCATTNAGGALIVINISNIADITPVATYDSGSCYGIAISGNYAFLAQHMYGLTIVDITDPLAPKAPGGGA